MILNRIRLTPALRAKLPSQGRYPLPSRCSAEFDEALFLINLRLRELALLLPLKLLAIKLIRKRMTAHGVTQRLELELAEQREQLKDLSQLSQYWLKLRNLITQQPSSNNLSEPLKAILRRLGVDFAGYSGIASNIFSAKKQSKQKHQI
jgi:hypothetical protein